VKTKTLSCILDERRGDCIEDWRTVQGQISKPARELEAKKQANSPNLSKRRNKELPGVQKKPKAAQKQLTDMQKQLADDT
jgi:hypothetical protein